MSVSSERINYLIWRYLQESGRPLAALAFDKETQVSAKDAEQHETPPGELVRLVIKGIQMTEVEGHLDALEQQTPALKPKSTAQPAVACTARHGNVAIGTDVGTFIGPDQALQLDTNSPVTCISWNNLDQLAQGCLSGQLRVWDTSATLLRALNRHSASISLLKWNRSSTHLFSADISGKACVWEGSSVISEATISPLAATWIDARTLAVGAGRNIMVYKLDLSHPHTEFHGHLAPVSTLQFDQNSHLLASGADDGVVNAWHGRSQQPIRSLKGPTSVVALEWIPLAAPQQQADAAITSKLLVAYTQSVSLWDLRDPDSTTQLWSIPLNSVVLIAHCDGLLAIASSVLSVYQIGGSAPALVGEYTPAQPITDLCWDRKTLWAASGAGSISFEF